MRVRPEALLETLLREAREEAAKWDGILRERMKACREAGVPEDLLEALSEAARGYHQAVGRMICAGLVKQFTSEAPGDTMGEEPDDRKKGV